MAPTQDCPNRHKHTNQHFAKKKGGGCRHIDYNIENIRQNPEQLKRRIENTPLREKYEQIKTIEIAKSRIQLNNTPTPHTYTSQLPQPPCKTLRKLEQRYKNATGRTKTRIPQTTKTTKKEHNADEKIKPQAEITPMENEHIKTPFVQKNSKSLKPNPETKRRNSTE